MLKPQRTRELAAMLRIAVALDRGLKQHVEDVRVTEDGSKLTFAVSSKYGIEVELAKADDKADLFRQAFGFDHVRFIGALPPWNGR